jgi:hypothetical protein
VKVRIYTPHTHAGKKYEPGPDGMDIEVPEHDAKFLEGIGATKPPKVETASSFFAKH